WPLSDTSFDWVNAQGGSLPRLLGCSGAAPWWSEPRNVIQRSLPNVARVDAWASCDATCTESQGVVADIEVASFRADVRDDAKPVATAVRGPLVDNATHSVAETLQF